MMPATPAAIACRAALIAALTRAGVSEISVGSSERVPRAAWASAMRARVSGVWASLNITPPPPLT